MTKFIKPDFETRNIDRTIPTISISAILGMIEEPFDKEGVAQKTFDNHFNNPNSEYYQMSVKQIIEKWEQKGATSCHYGSMLDDYIGNILTGNDTSLKLFKLDNDFDNDKRLQGLCESFDNFYSILSKSGDTIFVDREKTVYHKVIIVNPDNPNEELEYYIKGRFDALFFNKRTNKWIIIDWKSSGSIDKVSNKWTKQLLGPMKKFPALNYYTYTTQLYFYKLTLIEEGYLPEGTTPDDVVVMIVNLPGKIIEDLGRNFGTHQAAYEYNKELLDNLFTYCATKDYLNKKIIQEDTIEEKIKEQDDNLENIF